MALFQMIQGKITRQTAGKIGYFLSFTKFNYRQLPLMNFEDEGKHRTV